MRSILWAVVATFPFVITAQAGDLQGTWIYDTQQRAIQPWKGDSDSIVIRLVFKKSNGVLTGTYVSTMGSFPLSDLTVHGNKVSFAARYFGDATATWHGALKGSELRLQGGGEEDIYHRATAGDLKKVAAEPVYSFKRLPMPPLHDVPSNGLALTPPMGIGNWTEGNDAAVRKLADLMVANGMRDAGYVYIQIDEGWQGRRDAQGNLRPNDRFPDMKALADYLHSKGFKLGVYSSPGPMACYGYSGSHGHEEQDAKTFASWGVDYLKYDWCSADSLYHTAAEMRARYQKMGEALEASGRPILFGLCQYGWHDVGSWGKNAGGNLWRTSDDIANNWTSMSMNGFDLNGAPGNAGPGHWNDPDDLQIGKKGLTVREQRTQMTLWSVMAAPLIVEMYGGNDMWKWSPQVKAIALNREVIAVDQDKLGVQGQRVFKEGLSEVWTKRLAGNATAVAVFNRGDYVAQSVHLHWADIGLRNVESVRDLWQHRNLNGASGSYEVSIPAHGSVLLRVTSAQ
ncbi:MAG TPA: glycoside hydrolase family 27 protein [Steroidobacteraceae bacterium]|jgi:alpha-galactosidase